jgi:SAM-dependent methyltransferase
MRRSSPITDPDEWWQTYRNEYGGRSWKNYRALLSEFVWHAEGPPLLDVGCGYGFLVECARQFGIGSIGLEASQFALEQCMSMHPDVDVRKWSGGQKLPLDTASVGGAVLNEFVDHITIEHNRLLFSELLRVLRPNGLLLVKSPSRHNRFDDDEGHVTFFSPSEFRTFVESFGFHVIEQPYTPQPLLGTSRIGLRAMGIVTKFFKPEDWAARIDIVARKRG